MLDVYAQFTRRIFSNASDHGQKTADERFPGAENTFTIEAMMQDRKALQAGTSHFLGQNFAKAFNIQFINEPAQIEHAGLLHGGSTRIIGGLIMMHSDDNGLVLPPRIASAHVVIITDLS